MITNCPECRGRVSSQAPTCVHCGYPLEAEPEAIQAPQLAGDLAIGAPLPFEPGWHTEGLYDPAVNSDLLVGKGRVSLTMHVAGVLINRGSSSIKVHQSQVTGVSYIDRPTTVHLERSAKKRAAVGALLGPGGMILGALTAQGKKAKDFEGFLLLEFWDEEGARGQSLAIAMKANEGRAFIDLWHRLPEVARKAKSDALRRSQMASNWLRPLRFIGTAIRWSFLLISLFLMGLWAWSEFDESSFRNVANWTFGQDRGSAPRPATRSKDPTAENQSRKPSRSDQRRVAPSRADSASARSGSQLIRAICKEYSLDAFYSRPSKFGARTVIWLPRKAWNQLSPEQQKSVEDFMQLNYSDSGLGWGIGVGRVDGIDVLADDLILTN
ncbi:hypothetical protein OAF93_01900 [Planctomycetota bacterium]|nr:hypothetical protein [Planctomycetota bacterium]